MFKVLERLDFQSTSLKKRNFFQAYSHPQIKVGSIKVIPLESGTRSKHNNKRSEGNQIGIYWKRSLFIFIFTCS